MSSTPISLVDRAGLDRPRLAKIISRGLDGADDGELFLEYRQSEALVFDNGRLKQATYDTIAGFWPARGGGRGGRLCARLRTFGGGDRARRRRRARGAKAAIPGITPSRRRAATSSSMATIDPLATAGFEDKVQAAAEHRTPMPAPRTRGCARSRRACRRTGRRSRSCAPTARPIATCGRWCG